MAQFLINALEADTVMVVVDIDPAIDWEATPITRSQYREDIHGQRHQLVKLEGQDFIEFEIKPPTQKENLLAINMADCSIKDGEVQLPAEYQDFNEGIDQMVLNLDIAHNLALLCVTDAYNLDGWPSPCRVPYTAGCNILTEQALQSIPEPVQRHILEFLGIAVGQMSTLGEPDGKASDALPTGQPSSDGTSTQTIADSVETLTSEPSGVVTHQRSPADPDEMTH